MIIKTRGVIFRTVKYSETSYIADIYTEEKGLRSYIISGVRKKKASVSQGLLQVMSLVEMVAYEKKGGGLNRIKEIRPAYLFQEIPFRIYKSSVGLFMAELCSKTIKEAEENRELFEFIFNGFKFLDQSPHGIACLPLVYMLELSKFLGFQPDDDYGTDKPLFDLKEGVFTKTPTHPTLFLDERMSAIFFLISQASIATSHELEITKQDRKLMLNKLVSYYQQHISGLQELNSHKILEAVFQQ